MSTVLDASRQVFVRRSFDEVQPYPPSNSRARDLTVLTALAAIGLLGLDQGLFVQGFTTGTVVVVALFPVWAFTLREFRFTRALMLLAGLALAWGAVLHQFNGDRSFKLTLALEVALLFITGIGGVGLILWARTILPLHWVVIAFAGGYFLKVLPQVPGSDNLWKYQLAIPVTLLLLAWASRAPGIGLTLLALGFIGLLSVAFDSRSFLGFCLLAFVLVIWQQRRRNSDRKQSKLATVFLLGVVVVGLYFLASTLLVEGYLGQAAQTRTVEQIQASGSLLTSGRPEWTGTLELMARNPMGFGLGTLPSSDDVWAAKSGMVSAGLNPDDGYIQYYMFGGHIKLHSITADMWASFGVVGLVLAIAIICILIYGFLDHLGNRTASGLVCMMAIIGIWDMMFGPIHSNLLDVMIALAIVIPVAGAARQRDHKPRARPPTGLQHNAANSHL